MSAQWWKRIFLGNAQDVEMDGTGRVLVAPELRQAAGITKDTMLLGMGHHFELWDKATYEAQEAQAMQGEMPEAFKDFFFLKAMADTTTLLHTTVLLDEAVDALLGAPALRPPASGSTRPSAAAGIPAGYWRGSGRMAASWPSTRTPRRSTKQRASPMRAFPFGTRVSATWPTCPSAARLASSWIWA